MVTIYGMMKALPEEDIIIAQLMAESDDCKWDYPQALEKMYEMHIEQKRYQAWKEEHDKEAANRSYVL